MAKNYSDDFWNTFANGQYINSGIPHPEDDGPEEDGEVGRAAVFEDLRENLLSQLESPQFSNRLKAQIRASLALHLTPRDVLTAKPPAQRPDPVRELANAVVAQHLATSGCEFALSVFLPESGLNRDLHPMTLPSLLAYLRVKYSEFRADDRSLLSLLVGHLPVAEDAISTTFSQVFARLQDGASEKSAKGVQTDTLKQEQDVLDLELQFHEVKSRLGWRTGQRFVVEDAMEKFRSDVASETKRIVLEEALRNKEAEIRHAVEEEQHRHARELLSVTANWEARMQDQQAKLDILRQRLQIADQKAFVERQDLLQQQEATAQRVVQNQNVLDDGLKSLDQKERQLVTRAKQVADFSKALQNKEAVIQLTVDQRVGELVRLKAKVFEEREEKLRKDEAALAKLKEHLTRSIMSESGEPDVTASIEPRPFLQKIKTEFSRLHRENQKLKGRLASIADYETLKSQRSDFEREVKVLRAQVSSLQRELHAERQEHTAMVRELTDKVVQPDHSMELLRREAATARDNLLLEGLRWEAEKGRLKSVVKDRGREIDRLKDRLSQQQEKFDIVNAKLTRMQGLSSQVTSMMMPHQSTLGMSPAAAAVSPARLRLPVPPPEPLSGDESSSSFSSITDAKMRIKALEQEASNMQAHFSQYRRYVTAQFHSPSTPLDEHAQPAKSFSSNFTRGQVDVQGRPEVPRKLLLTHYLIHDPKTYNNGPGFLSGPPTPPKLASSSSGEKDLGLSTRSLKMELREAEEKERFSAREENISANPKEEPEPIQVQLDFESKIDADVRELMAAAGAKDSSSPGLDMELGW